MSAKRPFTLLTIVHNLSAVTKMNPYSKSLLHVKKNLLYLSRCYTKDAINELFSEYKVKCGRVFFFTTRDGDGIRLLRSEQPRTAFCSWFKELLNSSLKMNPLFCPVTNKIKWKTSELFNCSCVLIHLHRYMFLCDSFHIPNLLAPENEYSKLAFFHNESLDPT